MKNLYFHLLMLISLFFATVIISCQKEEMQKDKISAQEREKIVNHGKKSAEILMKTLKKELLTAMGEAGVSGAIDICKNRALQITDSLAQADPMVVDIRRTTKKYRNPNNMPDEVDLEILTNYEEHVASGNELPDFMIREIQKDGKVYHRYYKPLQIQPLCISCHGDRAKMKKEIVSILASTYPEDKAHGYKPHEFRGLIRVTLAENILSGD